MAELKAKIEALLLVLPGPLEIEYLAKKLNTEKEEVVRSLEELREKYKQEGSGLRILLSSQYVSLVAASEYAPFVKELVTQDIEEDLTPAALETLSIIAYRGPISRAEIEDLRGVNSIYILRQLLLKGLVERIEKKEQNVFLYKISFDFLKYLGIENEKELVGYTEFSSKTPPHEDAMHNEPADA